MKKKCLLISPPGEQNVFPRGIMEIATFLNRKGYPCAVLPLGHFLKKQYPRNELGYLLGELDKGEVLAILKDALSETEPAVVGVSNCYTKDYAGCLDIIRMCKEISPGIVTVMGGPHVTFCDEDALQRPELDIVVRGEGEWVMASILQAVEAGGDLGCLRGITIRGNGGVQRNPPEVPGDVDTIPPVDFGILPGEFVRNAYIHGILSRGCAYHCKYCAEEKFWGKPRFYRIEKLIEEMQALQGGYGRQMSGLEESMLDLRSKRFFELCRRIRENIKSLPDTFYITTRIGTVTDEGARAMRETGISMACVGIESFSPGVLKMMNKEQSVESVERGCSTLAKHQIWVHAYWLIGHPGDSPSEAEHSFLMFKKFFEKGLLKSGNAFVFVPYPGTEFYDHPETYGIRISSYDWKRWRRWTKEPVSSLDSFSAEQIAAFYQRAQRLLLCYKELNDYLEKKRPF
jgi:anaerobic magnesium-protoporphyrin IX monomethyl ester cyclase